MNLGPLIEVILYVSDMDRAVRFYRDVLGIKPVGPQLESYRDEFWVVFETGGCQLCLHGGGGAERGADSPKIVFHVDDIHAARQELLGKGAPAEPVFSPVPGVLVCNSVDSEGNRFSLEAR